MADKTGTVCAGVQANNKNDCKEFYNRLDAKNYALKAFGNSSSSTATGSNFNTGRGGTVMYWSSHGSANGGTYKLQGSSWFSVGSYCKNWSRSDKIECLVIAACWAFENATLRKNWANTLKQSNLFIVCGYGQQAPAGSNTDTEIVKSFFNNLSSKGVAMAWKAGNQGRATSSWGAISYGKTTANKNFTLPGWGTNSGLDRVQPIYLLRQAGNSVIISPFSSSAPMNALSITSAPYAIRVADEAAIMALDKLGDATISSDVGITDAVYRDEVDGIMDQHELFNVGQYAVANMGGDVRLQGANVCIEPITRIEIGEEAEGEEEIIGGDIVYQQQFNGIPLEDSFLRVCVDADGVYRVVNKWTPIVESNQSVFASSAAVLTASEAALEIPNTENYEVANTSLTYVNDSNGILTLCHKIVMTNGDQYLVDTRTGEVK